MGFSSTKDDTDLLGMTWLQNTPKEKILTRHRQGVPRAAHPNQTYRHSARGTEKPSQGQELSVSLRSSQIARKGTAGRVSSPLTFFHSPTYSPRRV